MQNTTATTSAEFSFTTPPLPGSPVKVILVLTQVLSDTQTQHRCCINHTLHVQSTTSPHFCSETCYNAKTAASGGCLSCTCTGRTALTNFRTYGALQVAKFPLMCQVILSADMAVASADGALLINDGADNPLPTIAGKGWLSVYHSACSAHISGGHRERRKWLPHYDGVSASLQDTCQL